MKLTKKTWPDGTFRLEAEEGSVCTVHPEDGKARLLSLVVPEERRRTGQGRALLAAAEAEAQALGYSDVYCDFSSKLLPFRGLLEQAGYAVSEQGKLLSVQTAELFASAGVQKSLRMKFPGMSLLSFADLMSFQLMEVEQLLQRFHFPATSQRLARSDQILSSMAYDSDYAIRSVLLVAKGEQELRVELLAGVSRSKPQFALGACQKFMQNVQRLGLEESHPKLVVLDVGGRVVPILRRLMDKNYQLTEEAVILHAQKQTPPDTIRPELTDEQTAQPGEEPWRQDLSDIPWQNNINEKYQWVAATQP